MRDHMSTACPTKGLGTKCFECGEHGHIASKCAKKNNELKTACAVVYTPQKKYMKDVTINGQNTAALIDTGSDISLMRADEYARIGSPRSQTTEIRFSGVGSDDIAALVEFQAEITIDGQQYPILIRVVSNTVSRHKLLIRADFLDTVEMHVKQGEIKISPIRESICGNDQPEIFQIVVANEKEVNNVDFLNIRDANTKRELTSLIEAYNPSKTVDADVRMKLVLKDDEPVNQKARRLSPSERDIVNKQINEWQEQGIVRPSSSDYASPVVLVKKKNGSHRLCIDYRLLNKKIIKDRYPLPLIEDQLDQLQDTKVFSTLELKNGFFHVRMDDASVKYTAFIVPDGQFEFLRVPFGLCNSPSVFQ